MSHQRQLPLFGRLQECEAYLNKDRFGCFSILTDKSGRKEQRSYPLRRMVEVIEGLDPRFDTWCSQAEFRSFNRRSCNLAQVSLQFLDLDTYQVPWLAGRPPQEQVNVVLRFCDDEGILPPSLYIFSGRGLQLKWFLENPTPRPGLPRWDAIQKALVERLRPLGADLRARDVSRVLRVVQTVNSKSGEMCRVVHAILGDDGHPIRYNFEQMAFELLPLSRQESDQRKMDLAQRQELRVLVGGKTGHLRGFSGRQLAWDRLEDLRLVYQLRGGAREGERMTLLFWQINFMSLSGAISSRTMYYEAAFLAKQIDPKWNYRSPELMTLYGKAKEFEAGVRVDFGGRKYPPLYTPRNSTLISLFEITDDEQRQLKTIISSAMAAERHRLRDESRRRGAGEVERQVYLGRIRLNADEAEARHRARDEARRRAAGEAERQAYLERVRLDADEAEARHRARDEVRRRAAGEAKRQVYLEAAEARRKKAQTLQEQGLSIRKIAKQMKCSKNSVERYLKAR